MSQDKPAALVTGSSSGIGRAVVLALAQAGYDVAINYSSNGAAAEDTAAAARDFGAKTIIRQCDVTDEAGVRDMVQAVRETFGRMDVLVNNAGITSNTGPEDLEGMDMDEWDRVFAVNVRGLFQVSRAFAPLLKKTHGCIVNSASIVGLRPGPQPFVYAASKAAVVSLTKTLAGALGPDVRVNAVAPGWVEGDWMKRTLGENYDRLMERRARFTPLGRCVTTEEVAETMLSLIKGNLFVTGQIIVVDGGYSSTT